MPAPRGLPTRRCRRSGADAAAARCAELMAEPKVWVDRLRPSPKRLNIRPYFRAERAIPLNASRRDGGSPTARRRADEISTSTSG